MVDLWGTASWVLKCTHLLVQLEYLYGGNTHKSHGWAGAPTNQVPPVVHLTRTTKETSTKASTGWVLEALDLQGLTEWSESEQKQARELLLKWEHLFAHSDLDLGKTALIKHKIQLMDQMPFKECYQLIPPHMYDNVRAHIQEMLDIVAIHKSTQSMG